MARATLKEFERTKGSIAPVRGAREAVDEVITPSQVATLLKIHVKTVYRLAEAGTIPGSRIGRSWRFSKKTILKLVSGALNHRLGAQNPGRPQKANS